MTEIYQEMGLPIGHLDQVIMTAQLSVWVQVNIPAKADQSEIIIRRITER